MNKKSILVGIAVLLLAVVGGIAGATYSRYISSASTTPTAKVAKWKVTVNNVDITGKSETFEAPITWEENENIANDVIAPGRKGTSTLTIDPSGSQVAVKYSIKIGDLTGANGEYTNPVEVESIQVDGVTLEYDETTKTYSKDLELTELKPQDVKVNVIWKTTNDENDTAAGVAEPTISIPLTVTAEQFIASE